MIDLESLGMSDFSYAGWTAHFAQNGERRLNLDISQEISLTQEEKNLIFPSIRAFQRGEGSDGACLMRTVEDFIQKTGQTEYRPAMEWFIREENWHSAYLKQYMDLYQVSPLNRSWLDRCFRWLRQLGGLNCEVTVLVTAEIIALSYYDALSRCTRSPVLQSICRKMLEDELPHVVFQSYTLSWFSNTWMTRLAHEVLMDVTSCLVWCAFHRVFQAGGYRFGTFLRENRGYLKQSAALSRRLKHEKERSPLL